MSAATPLPVVRSALVVDDHEPDRFWARRVLERSGRFGAVHVVASAREALELLVDPGRTRLAAPPVVVFLDINMPGMDGFEFLDEVEARRHELVARGAMPEAILMLSSSDDDRDVMRSRAHDLVRDYFVKPIQRRDAMSIADRYGSPAA